MRSAIPRDLVSPSGYPSSVGASHPRRHLSSSVGTTYLRRTESGRPNLTGLTKLRAESLNIKVQIERIVGHSAICE